MVIAGKVEGNFSSISYNFKRNVVLPTLKPSLKASFCFKTTYGGKYCLTFSNLFSYFLLAIISIISISFSRYFNRINLMLSIALARKSNLEKRKETRAITTRTNKIRMIVIIVSWPLVSVKFILSPIFNINNFVCFYLSFFF